MFLPKTSTRWRLLAAALLAVAPVSLAQNGSGAEARTDFRQVRWGMTPAEVRAAEAAPPAEERESEGEPILIYKDGAEPQALVVYSFAGGKLVRAQRIFAAGHPGDVNAFVADFRAEQARLASEHGQPQQDRAVWVDDSLQEERIAYLEQDRAHASDILPSDRFAGVAVSLGQLKLYVAWCGGRTRILHTLTGADSRVTHQVEYLSVRLAGLESRGAESGCAP